MSLKKIEFDIQTSDKSLEINSPNFMPNIYLYKEFIFNDDIKKKLKHNRAKLKSIQEKENSFINLRRSHIEKKLKKIDELIKEKSNNSFSLQYKQHINNKVTEANILTKNDHIFIPLKDSKIQDVISKTNNGEYNLYDNNNNMYSKVTQDIEKNNEDLLIEHNIRANLLNVHKANQENNNNKINLPIDKNYSKAREYMALFKKEGVSYQPFPTIEDMIIKNNNLLHTNKNNQNMKKVIRMRMYDNDVQNLSNISKILNKPVIRKNSNTMSNPLKKSLEKKQQIMNKKSISQDNNSKHFFLTSTLQSNITEKLNKRSSSSIIQNISNMNPPPILNFNKPYEEIENDVIIFDSPKHNNLMKKKLKFLEIYKSSSHKEEFVKTLKKKKNISLQKYQENLINAIADEIQPKDLVNLITKFNEIRVLNDSNNTEYLSNNQFYDQLINILRTELFNVDDDYEKPIKNTEKKVDEIKFKYKKKVLPDKKMEKLKNIIPKYLLDKLSKNNL